MNRFDGHIRPNLEKQWLKEAYLPNLFVSSHAANLLELDNGDLLCVWFSGSEEGNPDCMIIMSRLPAGTETWTTPIQLSSDTERSEQNPLLFQAPSGQLWLLHTSNTPHNQKTSRVMRRISEDRGHTWSEPEIYWDNQGLFIRHPIVVLPNGDWILPAYYCKEDVEYSIVIRSTDQGVTWREHEVPDSAGYVQMNILPLQDGSLYAMFRSRNADRIYASRSGDSGQTWTAPAKTDMPNNNSSMQAVVLGDRGMALIYNDASLENGQYRLVEKNGEVRKKALRTPLTVALSEDEGATWPYRLQLQEADAEYWENEIGYSYPSILRTSDGTLHIAFTYLRKGLKYFRLTESDIRL